MMIFSLLQGYGHLPDMSIVSKREDHETLNLPQNKEIRLKPKANLRS